MANIRLQVSGFRFDAIEKSQKHFNAETLRRRANELKNDVYASTLFLIPDTFFLEV
jgi:hypothetical protein